MQKLARTSIGALPTDCGKINFLGELNWRFDVRAQFCMVDKT
jgi:hypothetical protein